MEERVRQTDDGRDSGVDQRSWIWISENGKDQKIRCDENPGHKPQRAGGLGGWMSVGGSRRSDCRAALTFPVETHKFTH